MSKTSTYQTPFRRRHEGRTNYAKRLAYVKSGMPRAVVRKSTNNLSVQFIQTTEGKDSIVASAHTKELNEYTYKGHGGNVPAAYLTGYLAGKRMLTVQKEAETIVDFGIQPVIHGTRLFAAIKGIVDAGVKVKADAVSFPKEERVQGKHVDLFASKEPSKMNRTQFQSYLKNHVNVNTFSHMVETTKKTITERVKA
jgi:large subunit ribosomal protein L18